MVTLIFLGYNYTKGFGMRALLILFIFFSFSFSDVEVHLPSKHLYDYTSKGYKLNNYNFGIGYDSDVVDVGVYYNSIKRYSFYVKQKYKLYNNFNFEYGVATGYDAPFYNKYTGKEDFLYNTWVLTPIVGVTYRYENVKLYASFLGDNVVFHLSILF